MPTTEPPPESMPGSIPGSLPGSLPADASSPDDVLATEGLALGHAILVALPEWAKRVVGALAGPGHDESARAAGVTMAESLVHPLAELFTADVDRQRGTPLTLLRLAHAPVTALLSELGVADVVRDDADAAAAPDDRFAVAPRTFADLGPEVHEAGLRWGVAKAFAHRARHRSAS